MHRIRLFGLTHFCRCSMWSSLASRFFVVVRDCHSMHVCKRLGVHLIFCEGAMGVHLIFSDATIGVRLIVSDATIGVHVLFSDGT